VSTSSRPASRWFPRHPTGGPRRASLQLTAQTSEAKWPLRISAGVISIAVGFLGWQRGPGPAFDELHARAAVRLAGLPARLRSALRRRHRLHRNRRPRLKDLRVPSLSVAFASLNVLGYVAVFIAFPVVTPMLGGLSASAHGHRPDGPDDVLRRLAANSPLSTIRQAATGY
jgi:hypothetical protein